MKTYVYPAVIYKGDDGTYYISLPDLGLLTNGDTEEEVFVKGKECLVSYIELSSRFNTDVPSPSSFDECKAKYKPNDVVMLDVLVKKTEQNPTEEDDKYKRFMKLFFDEGD